VEKNLRFSNKIPE